MAATHWRTGHTVADLFSIANVGWSYYQLVRLLLPAGLTEDELMEQLNRRFYFNTAISRDFPPGDIRKINIRKINSDKTNNNNDNCHITSVTHNLAGLNGPLPDPFNDMLQENLKQGDGAMNAFLEVFSQRIQILRYLIRAFTNNGLSCNLAKNTHTGRFILALSGNLSTYHRQIYQQSESTFIGLAGSLSNRRLALPTVRLLLQTVMGLPLIAMQSFNGRWLTIDEDDHIRLGKTNHRLINEATLGTRLWDQQAGIELIIGPLKQYQLKALIPGGEKHEQFKQLLKWISDCRCDCKITFVCHELETTTVRLSSLPLKRNALGLLSWLPGRRDKDNKMSFVVKTVNSHGDN